MYKGNDSNKIINYKPLSILSQIGIIFENIIYNRMRDFIIKNKIINSNQYDFIEKSNTTVSHINLQHFIFSKHNAYADDTSLSIYANSDYEISENMKLYVGKLVH